MVPPAAYVTTADGIRIAWATRGRGRPVVSMPPIPFRHIELEWEAPDDRRWLERLAARHMLVQYDPRGLGLSERGITDYSLDALLLDVDAVVSCLAPEPVALFAAVNAGPLAIAYAARHPEGVSHLVLWCSSPRAGEGLGALLDALIGLVGHDWELATETAAHVLRGWSAGDSARKLATLLRAAAAPETVHALYRVVPSIDVSDLLPEVRCPTLVLHRREVTWLPVERATELASRIPGARLVVLEGNSMAPWAGDIDAVARTVDEFLGAPAADEPAPAGGETFRREGEYWTLAFAGRLCRVRDAKGLHHIAHLLGRPGAQVPATELVATLDGAGAPAAPTGDAGPALDARAKAAYRRRLDDLRAELAEAEEWNDEGRAGAARAEIEAITGQLAAAVGLGGRDRPTGAAGERARVTVTKRIKDAIDRVRRVHPALGDHLARSVRTGVLCTYGPDAPVRWSL
jgi:pimeloyl-ACP methyl ester carboxylesterase